MATSERVFTLSETAALLGYSSERSVHRLIAEGKLEATKIGTKTRVRESALVAFHRRHLAA
jgi:excisionase family DNA binding protein